jgi:hypothetical protein
MTTTQTATTIFMLGGLRLNAWIPGAGVTVGGSTASGAEIAGSIGGLVGALVGLVGLVITIASMNAKRRREYEREIREAEKRGEDRMKSQYDQRMEELTRDLTATVADRDFYRNLVWAVQQHPSAPLPIPPSESGGNPA